MILDITPLAWGVILFSAFLIGLSKNGVPGVGIVAAPFAAIAMDTRMSVGILLPILIVGDIFAVSHYRGHASWKTLRPLALPTALGIIAGFLVLDRVDSRQLGVLLGVSVLVLIGLSVYKDLRPGNKEPDLVLKPWFAPIPAVGAGITSTMANSAGPIMILYFLALRLPKREFIATSAWFFLVVNFAKVPFFVHLDLITLPVLGVGAVAAPFVIGGAFAGVWLLKRIPYEWFKAIALGMAGLSATWLLVKSLAG